MDLAALQSVLNLEYREPLADLVARSNPFLAAIPKVGSAGGHNIPLKAIAASNHNARAVADGSTITVTSPTTTFVGGTLPWATYVAEFKVNARLMAELQGQPEDVGRVLQNEVMNAGKDLASQIAADMWKGNVTNGLVGVKSIISDTGTYAGIDRASVTAWQGVVYDAAGAEISTGMLEEAEHAFFTRNRHGIKDRVSEFTAMLTPYLLVKYSALFENIDLSSIATAHFVNRANDTGYLGKSVVGWMGIPFVRDPDVDVTGDTAGTGRLYFMNMDHIKLAVLTPMNEEVQRSQKMIDHYGIGSAPKVDTIDTQIEILGKQGEFVAGYVKAYVQMFSENPREAGLLIKNISAA